MKNKSKKKPKENLIQSVLDDLKNDDSESSLHIGSDEFEALLNAGRSRSSVDVANVLQSSLSGLKPETNSKSNPASNVSFSSNSNSQSHSDSNPQPKSISNAKPASKDADSEEDKTTVLSEEPSAAVFQSSPSTTRPRKEVPPEEKDDHTMVVGRAQASANANPPRAKSSVFETQFAQAENMKIAQNRILELEKEMERLRKENEVLSSAGDISKNKLEEFIVRVHQLEKQKQELKETNESELRIFKDGLIAKDTEIQRLRNKVEELESRLSNDLRKVRVRERELENRLELAKAEKAALLRAKDENILELKRKTDSMQNDLENYQTKIIELNQKLEGNQEQFARTVRALRIALTNLEVSDGTSPSIHVAPLKKAE